MSTHNTCKTRSRECESLVGKYSCESEFGFLDPKYSRVRVRVTHECTRGQPYEAEIDIFDHYHNVEVGLRRNELCLCLVVCIEKKKEMGGGTQIDELFIEVQVDANIRRDKKICKLAIQSECISCCRVMRSRWQGRKLPDCLQKRVSQYNILLIIRIHQRSDMT